MPTSNEKILNNPLTAAELCKIILSDLDSALDRDAEITTARLRLAIKAHVERNFANDSMLSSTTSYGRLTYTLRTILHLADLSGDAGEEFFGRVAYEVSLEMKLPIVAYPLHRNVTQSAPVARNIKDVPHNIEGPPPLAKPIDPYALILGTERRRTIDNPHLERIRFVMPIPIAGPKGADGKRPAIIYSPADAGIDDPGAGQIEDRDLTEELMDRWGIVPPPAPVFSNETITVTTDKPASGTAVVKRGPGRPRKVVA